MFWHKLNLCLFYLITTHSASTVAFSMLYSCCLKFSLPQIEYPLGGSSTKGSQSSLHPIDSCHGTTVMMSHCTIVTSGHHGSIRTTFISNNSTIWQNNNITLKTCHRKYMWLPFLLLSPIRYSIQVTDNCICDMSSSHQSLTAWSWYM